MTKIEELTKHLDVDNEQIIFIIYTIHCLMNTYNENIIEAQKIPVALGRTLLLVQRNLDTNYNMDKLKEILKCGYVVSVADLYDFSTSLCSNDIITPAEDKFFKYTALFKCMVNRLSK